MVLLFTAALMLDVTGTLALLQTIFRFSFFSLDTTDAEI